MAQRQVARPPFRRPLDGDFRALPENCRAAAPRRFQPKGCQMASGLAAPAVLEVCPHLLRTHACDLLQPIIRCAYMLRVSSKGATLDLRLRASQADPSPTLPPLLPPPLYLLTLVHRTPGAPRADALALGGLNHQAAVRGPEVPTEGARSEWGCYNLGPSFCNFGDSTRRDSSLISLIYCSVQDITERRRPRPLSALLQTCLPTYPARPVCSFASEQEVSYATEGIHQKKCDHDPTCEPKKTARG